MLLGGLATGPEEFQEVHPKRITPQRAVTISVADRAAWCDFRRRVYKLIGTSGPSINTSTLSVSHLTPARSKHLTAMVNFDAKVAMVLSPVKLAHIVLRTNNFDEMVQYYKDFLGAEVIYQSSMLAFLTYDEEHHRIAIGDIPGTKAKDAQSSGLEHIAFSFKSITDLLLTYRQRKQKGIEPVWPVNHGPATSIYYRDPDGNMIETQADNFDTVEEATDFMKSKFFSENPIGTDFDPEEYIARLQKGESELALRKRIEIGPRGIPSFG